MFLTTYKNTFKNLIRSTTFWLIVAVLAVVVTQGAIDGFYGGDDDPNFALNYKDYVQCIINSLAAKLLMYAFPIFTVITVALVLNRDYGDKFFEIEKAANVKPSAYLYGRLTALLSVNFIILLLSNLLCMYLYLYIRDGVEELTTWEMISETFIRVLRVDIFVGMPSLVFYIGLTYFVGAIFKSGIPAAIVGLGHAIWFYAGYLILRLHIGEWYFNYFSPVPKKLRQFFHYYDTEWFEDTIKRFDTSLAHVAFCISFLVGIAVLCSVVSHLRVRQRNN